MDIPVWMIVIFGLAFLSVMVFINYFIFSRFAKLAGFKPDFIKVLLISIVPALLFIISMLLARYYETVLLKSAYFIASYWLGISLIAFFFLLCSEIILIAWPVFMSKLYLASFICSALLSVYAIIHAQSIAIKTVNIDFEKKLTIVQVSDIHYGAINGDKYLDKVVEIVNANNPDIILFTGDLVDGTRVIKKDTLYALKKLKAPAYLVTGNHEFYDGFEKVIPAIEESNVKVIDDKEVIEQGVQIIGCGFSMDKRKVEKLFETIKARKDMPSILLNHEPVSAKIAAKNKVKLMLSGHTHNGQIFPFNILVRIAYPMIAGKYEVEGMTLFVSSGCGTWGPKMRLCSDNEINVIKLRGSK